MSGETTRIVATPTLSRFKGRHPNHYLRKCAIGIPEREDDSSVDLLLKRNIQIVGNPASCDWIGIRIPKEVQVRYVRSQVQHRERADGTQENAHDAGSVHIHTGPTVQVQNLRDDVRFATRSRGAYKASSSHVTRSPDFVEGEEGSDWRIIRRCP